MAARLFARQGYAATGIAELCAETGLAKGALYHYIGSKEALLVEIQNWVLGPLLDAARRIQSLDEPPILRLRLLSETLLEVLFSRLDYVRVVERDLCQLSRDARTRLLGMRHAFESVVEEMLIEAMDEGVLRPTDSRLAMLQFFNMHNYTHQWLRPGTDWGPAVLAREYCATLFGGLATGQYRLDALEDEVASFRAGYNGEPISVEPAQGSLEPAGQLSLGEEAQ